MADGHGMADMSGGTGLGKKGRERLEGTDRHLNLTLVSARLPDWTIIKIAFSSQAKTTVSSQLGALLLIPVTTAF